MSVLVSHTEYFKLFPEEKKCWENYVVRQNKKEYKIVLQGFLKWNHQESWCGSFEGDYVAVYIKKYKTPLLKSFKQIQEMKIESDAKYGEDRDNWLISFPCKEKPYVIHMMGTDDMSYSKSYETLKAAMKELNEIKINSNFNFLIKVCNFQFTN